MIASRHPARSSATAVSALARERARLLAPVDAVEPAHQRRIAPLDGPQRQHEADERRGRALCSLGTRSRASGCPDQRDARRRGRRPRRARRPASWAVPGPAADAEDADGHQRDRRDRQEAVVGERGRDVGDAERQAARRDGREHGVDAPRRRRGRGAAAGAAGVDRRRAPSRAAGAAAGGAGAAAPCGPAPAARSAAAAARADGDDLLPQRAVSPRPARPAPIVRRSISSPESRVSTLPRVHQPVEHRRRRRAPRCRPPPGRPRPPAAGPRRGRRPSGPGAELHVRGRRRGVRRTTRLDEGLAPTSWASASRSTGRSMRAARAITTRSSTGSPRSSRRTRRRPAGGRAHASRPGGSPGENVMRTSVTPSSCVKVTSSPMARISGQAQARVRRPAR